MRTPPGYQDDQGIGWFLLYLGGAVPLGLGLLGDRQWIGLVLVTYFWWPTWWAHARGDYRRAAAVRAAAPAPSTPTPANPTQPGSPDPS